MIWSLCTHTKQLTFHLFFLAGCKSFKIFSNWFTTMKLFKGSVILFSPYRSQLSKSPLILCFFYPKWHSLSTVLALSRVKNHQKKFWTQCDTSWSIYALKYRGLDRFSQEGCQIFLEEWFGYNCKAPTLKPPCFCIIHIHPHI